MGRMITQREKVRFVLLYGKIRPLGARSWMFTAAPDREVPVAELHAPSRWDCIETVYDLIKGYGNHIINGMSSEKHLEMS
jgi:hypothetical protein